MRGAQPVECQGVHHESRRGATQHLNASATPQSNGRRRRRFQHTPEGESPAATIAAGRGGAAASPWGTDGDPLATPPQQATSGKAGHQRTRASCRTTLYGWLAPCNPLPYGELARFASGGRRDSFHPRPATSGVVTPSLPFASLPARRRRTGEVTAVSQANQTQAQRPRLPRPSGRGLGRQSGSGRRVSAYPFRLHANQVVWRWEGQAARHPQQQTAGAGGRQRPRGSPSHRGRHAAITSAPPARPAGALTGDRELSTATADCPLPRARTPPSPSESRHAT